MGEEIEDRWVSEETEDRDRWVGEETEDRDRWVGECHFHCYRMLNRRSQATTSSWRSDY